MAKRHKLDDADDNRRKTKIRLKKGEIYSPSSSKPHPAMGLVFAGVGLYPLLVGMGVVPVDPGRVHCPLFVLIGIGVAFISGGLAVTLQGLGVSPKSWVTQLVGLLCLGGILTPFLWIVFGNNSVPAPAKICFAAFLGLFVLIFALCTIATLVPGLSERLGIKRIE